METEAHTAITIVIAASHQEHRVNKHAPTSYAYTIKGPHFSESRWGYGSARETQEMLAQGLRRAAEHAMIEEANSIVVIVSKIGFTKYLTDFVPKWRAKAAQDPSFKRNNFRAWKKLHELYELGGLKIRVFDSEESDLIEEVKACAKKAATEALVHCKQNPELYKKAGVFVTDESQGT